MIINTDGMRQIETDSGIPFSDLMEHAGTALSEALKTVISRDENILILIGSGNNGGDGSVIARLLKDKYQCRIVPVCGSPKTDAAKSAWRKVPRRMKEISTKVQEVKDQLTTRLGRAPSLDEISEATGFTHEQIMQAMESAKAYGTFSLDSANNNLGEEGDENLLEKYVGFEEIGYERIEINEIIKSVLEQLNDNHRYVFKERFIFNKSQADIAKALGVSQMTVSRAEKAIIEKFKKEMNR
jgi:RNA polymerase sigma factor (sigma-70 family)